MEAWSAFLAATLSTTALLAGCLAPQEEVQQESIPLPTLLPEARLACPQDVCNFLATIEPERQGNEVTIAVNPLDPNNVVAGAKDYFPRDAGQCVWDGVYHTKDGARFASDNIPGSPWRLITEPGSFEPNVLSQYWCATDPVVAFGPDGTLYYSILAYQGDPVTASKVGKDQLGTGVNDFAFNRVSMAVAISRDGGASFDEIVVVDSGSFPVNFHDRQWIEVDQRSGNVYLAWTTIVVPGNMFYRSRDGGMTWDMPVLLNNPPTALHGPGGMYVATGPGGEVVVSGCGGDGPMLTVSTDEGSTFSGWELFAEGRDEGMEAEFRSGMVCMLAMDDSDGPYSGGLYMVWSDTRNGNRDIYFKAAHVGEEPGQSADTLRHGTAMSEPVRLNDDSGTADQFFPAISVNPNGVIDVVWYDRRNDAENRLLDIYHTYSLDGGATWSPNFRVTELSSDPVHSLHQGGFTFIGDYIDLDSSAECAWPVWVDTRAEKADVMTACVKRPAGPVVPGA